MTCPFARFPRCNNSCVACYAPIATPSVLSTGVPLRHDHRKLGAGFVTLPQMTGPRVGMPFVLSTPALARSENKKLSLLLRLCFYNFQQLNSYITGKPTSSLVLAMFYAMRIT
jgi:hypothetical protein